MKLVFKNAAVFGFLLICLEFFLFIKGFQRGILDNNRVFKKVDELVLLDGYACDQFGITRVSPDAGNYLKEYVAKNEKSNWLLERQRLSSDKRNLTTYFFGRDYVDVNNYKVKNEFATFINGLKNKDSLEPVELAYLNYVKCPINQDGFRSIEFSYFDTNKKKVLLLGDSFTWGHYTKNKTNSFADILSARGYVIYNSGVTGTDLPQYYAVANKYICTLKPDVVIVNLFLGNDVAEYDRKAVPFVPVFFTTNAGLINSCPHGKYFKDAGSAYNYVLKEVSIPGQDKNLCNFFAAQTRITTILWKGLAAYGIADATPDEAVLKYWSEVKDLKTGYRVNREYLEKIQRLCEEINSELIVSIIPEMDRVHVTHSEIKIKLDGFKFDKIENLDKSDYKKRNGHFNEQGHEKYATYLIRLIEE